jgi:tripartite-type tricarboxylate transporter receptor subunit TctC
LCCQNEFNKIALVGGFVLTRLGLILGSCLLFVVSWTPAFADDSEAFYKSHALRIVVGHEVGTGFDLYARLLARFMGQNLAGHPTLIPENMVGAAGLVSANWLYHAAPQDGSVIATFAHTAAFDPLLGDSAGRYDARQFNWIGSMDSVIGLCGVWRDSGISRFDDLFTKETLMGSAGSGTAGPLTQFPTALRNLLGVKIKLIQGYRGSADVRLAMQRGEVSGVCGIPLSTVMTEWREDYRAGRFKIILQLGRDKDPALGGVPHIYDYAKTDDDRKLFDLIFGLQAVGRPFAAPPRAPEDRIRALRTAFQTTLAAGDFRAEAAKLQLNLAPMTDVQVSEFVQTIYAAPAAIVARAKVAVKP